MLIECRFLDIFGTEGQLCSLRARLKPLRRSLALSGEEVRLSQLAACGASEAERLRCKLLLRGRR